MKGAPGLIIAAPASGSGKTTLTLALLRHLRDQNIDVASFKVGPDYIDPAFHEAASGAPCRNADSWAMRPGTLESVLSHGDSAELVVCEGVMGLFDGAPGGGGSAAELSRITGWPIILIVDVQGMGASVAALVEGFCRHDPEVNLAGIIFNRVGSPRHLGLLREAVSSLDVKVLGGMPRDEALSLPDRHLGLVQAAEHPALDLFLDFAANIVALHIDVAAVRALAAPRKKGEPANGSGLPILGQHIAVARDLAFLFSYPAQFDAWRSAGAELSFFSPLEDEAPSDKADAVFLPGGYPELHAGRLAGNEVFLGGLKNAAARGAFVYGECGGYMVMGQGLEDAEGLRHEMAGLLPLEASFATRHRNLGYRTAQLHEAGPLGAASQVFRGHEFHYATIVGEEGGDPLFQCSDTHGEAISSHGARRGNVMGSFIHLIDSES